MIPIPTCRLLLAPADGRVRDAAPEREPVAAGGVVAVLDTPSGARDVVTAEAGRVGGLLVDPGRAVRRGAPVAWLAR